MTNILEVYKQYKTPPKLLLHQLRVAAVAWQICDNFTKPINKEDVITACLLHDMANIIKFDLSHFPESLQPEGRDYWEGVKQEFIDKYGPDEHAASVTIARELGMNQRVLDCIEAVDFKQAPLNVKRTSFEPKICDYSDLRVTPQGVMSVKERLDEGRKRYAARPDKWMPAAVQTQLTEACFEEERQIFERTTIKPADITDESIAPYIEKLKQYSI